MSFGVYSLGGDIDAARQSTWQLVWLQAVEDARLKPNNQAHETPSHSDKHNRWLVWLVAQVGYI